ncbi:hypothetical protein PC9H_011247 [Pleurotus ostreatus]|uniref:Uncharacterized protein n=1 Tax=Pleurotus ostreatus TaxID=5322 RepID=A0A8H6ZID3_PLEOS|nr:uncharacterized protein PC9H_011247 [Pleurotus ostreatus]KAF7420729.1 hypothetical protein PC9H_011247 [Pleurotus ostreatus]KAJ8690120.1 hypothetical protein PTI98_011578 [Pleurotus ostreatus]
MRLLQSPHLNDFPQVCLQGLTPQRTAPADVTSNDDTPKDETTDRIMEFVLRSSGLRRTPSLSLSTLTSLSLSAQVRQPYEDFSNMLRGMTSLRQLTLVNSLPWTIPGAIPDFIGCKSERLPRAASPTYYDGAWPLAGTRPLAVHPEPSKPWPMFETTDSRDASLHEAVSHFHRELASWWHPVSPLVMPSTLRELTVHDHGFRCTQFFAIVACQLAQLEIKCVTDGFDPIPLFRESARLLHPLLREGALRELVVCSESDKLVVQCACSALPYCDSPIADSIVQPALSIALDFSADDGLPPVAIYEDIITTGVKALPLGSVCRMLVDFHADFRGAWFAGFFSCLGFLQSITLRRHAIDGFLQTHLWMAYNDPAAAMVPFRSLKTVFAEWDTRWPQVRSDADRILRYLNAGGVYLLFCNVGGHAEGFVRGP